MLCVPALAGLAAPWWDSAAAASFTGMTLSSGRGQLVRALLEGIAAQVAALADLVATDLGQPLTRLRVDGGLTRSAVLMQAQADLARIPVDVYPSLHATALGAAACARLALDPGLDVTEAVGTWTPRAHLRTRVVRRPRRRVLGAMDARGGIGSGTEGDNDHMSGTPGISEVFDVAVVGGGIVGCAIARALAGTNASVIAARSA